MRLHFRAVASVTAIILTAAAPAAAAGVSTSQAKQASGLAARAVGKQTHASSAKVLSCARVTGARAVCHAEAHYSSGAKRCTFDVTVTPASAKGQSPRTSPSNFICY
jgi:hypothetical protein